jgi:uncharacterized membrane protein
MEFSAIAEVVATVLDAAGVAVIVTGALVATVFVGIRLSRKERAYAPFRRALGRSILVGLEILVAADIIRTVAIKPTLEGVAVLGLIVAIRTVLSFTLELEISGRWPWQKKPIEGSEEPGAA